MKLSNLTAHARYNVTVLAVILGVFLIITLLQAYFTWSSINEERKNRERMEVNVNNERIDQRKETVMAILTNSAAGFEQQLDNASQVERLLMTMVRQNDELQGATVAYTPNYLNEHDGLYVPCVIRIGGNIRKKRLNYNYTSDEWYTKAMKTGKPEWSEPYTSNDETRTPKITLSVPLHDKGGRQVAVLAGDLPMSELAYVTDTIYHESSLRSIVILSMQVIGLLLIVFVGWRAFVSMRKFQNVTKVNEQINDELSIATNLQSQILPNEYPQHKGLEVKASLVPGTQVSGDFYDFLLQGDKLFFCIADVSTHGIAACIALAVTRTACRASMQSNDALAQMMGKMNQTLIGINENGMFATLFACQLDLTTGLLRYCNAGHLAPYWLTGKGAAPLEVKPNVPLGITEWAFEEQQVQLHPGDTIFLYTEGIIEAMNEQNVIFGDKKLALHLKNASESADSPEALLKRVDNALKHHLGTEGKAADDLTMLAVRYGV